MDSNGTSKGGTPPAGFVPVAAAPVAIQVTESPKAGAVPVASPATEPDSQPDSHAAGGVTGGSTQSAGAGALKRAAQDAPCSPGRNLAAKFRKASERRVDRTNSLKDVMVDGRHLQPIAMAASSGTPRRVVH